MGEAFRYAWRGSDKHWDAAWLAIIGGVLGGLAIWALGLKMPQTIMDNPLWGAVTAIAVGAIVGVVCVFLARLAWWPIHIRLKRQGGFIAALRAKFGAGLLPLTLAVAGLVLFFGLEAAAVIAFVLQSPATSPQLSPQLVLASPPKEPQFPLRAPSDADKEIPVIDKVLDLLRDLSSLKDQGMTLSNHWFEALAHPNTLPTYDDDLREYGRAINAASAKIALLKNQSPQYFEGDIELITDKADFENLYRTFSNFVGALFSLRNIADKSKSSFEDTQRVMAPHTKAFEKASGIFGDWITNSRESLLNRRKDLSRIAATK